MLLKMDASFGDLYTSRLQMVRAITEQWAAENIYCAACTSDRLVALRTGMPARDFRCPNCSKTYQLKSGHKLSRRRITDGAYSAMMAAVASDDVPNLLLLNYASDWQVQDLTLIPSFFFTASVIDPRKPLSPTARRAGWVGCTIALDRIPPEGRMSMVESGVPANPSTARAWYTSISPLSKITPSMRGWTLDVLNVVHRLQKRDFSLGEVYAGADYLARLHPNNQHIRPKIRQRLQVLRDLELLEFLGNGQYRLNSVPTFTDK